MWRAFGWFLGICALALAGPRLAWAEAPAAAECFPHCRSGFTCHEGRCVSLCNPPCAAGERCLASGECEAAPAASTTAAPTAADLAPPAPAAAAPVAPSGPAPIAEEATPAVVPKKQGRFVLGAHVGVLVLGVGHAGSSCETEGNVGCVAETADVNDNSRLLLGVDALLHASEGLRLGVAYWLVPYSAFGFEPNHTDARHVGHEHALLGVLEGLLPLRRGFSATLRAQAGLRLLAPGGDLAETAQRFLDGCKNQSKTVHCEAAQGPFFGPSAGVMAGVVSGGRVRFRGDLALDTFTVKIEDHQFTDGGDRLRLSSRLYDTRFSVLVGLEL